MTRSPITSILLRGRGSWSQSTEFETPHSPVLNDEPSEHMEENVHAHHDFQVLHPSRRNGAKWFKNNTEVSTQVRKIIEGCFKGPWYSWKRVPKFYRNTWYSTFKTKFEWDASIEKLVKGNFDVLAATRLKGMVSLAKSKGQKPDWILSSHWREMLDYWKTPKAKDKSEKARSSRLFNRDGLGAHKHRSGSRSYAKVQDVLEANNEDSSFIAVMKKTHQKSDGSYVDEKARLIAEKYEESLVERLSQMDCSGEALTDPLTVNERNEIYVKVAGISKQGRVFGLGSLQSDVSLSSGGSSVAPEATEEIGTLTRRLNELETELKNSHDENAIFRKRLETVEKLVEDLFGNDVLASTDPSISTTQP